MSVNDGMPFLERLSVAVPTLRPSERRVAHVVAGDPAFVVASTMAGVAEAAGVSEPTVMRFATSLGFDGFAQLKLALAQTLALGRPATLASLHAADSVADLSARLFDHTISSLDRARRSLDPTQVEASVEAIVAATALTFAGLGASAVIALDAEQKAPLFGVPCTFPSDPHQQLMAAAMAGPGQVFVAVSNTGETSSVIEIARTARAAGATVIALTGEADTTLARLADIPVVVKTFEDTDLFTPTVSRLAGLVVVDILATAVSLRRGRAHADRLAEMKEQLATFRRSRQQ